VSVPRAFIYVTIIIVLLAMIPPALIASLRATNAKVPRVHLVQDMDNQPKFKEQHANPLFLDGRSMRPPVEGVVARDGLEADDHLHRGVVGDQWAETFPVAVRVDMAFLERGRERYNIYCTPCHGAAGYGDGMVNQRAMSLVDRGINGTTWVQPKSIHEEAIVAQPVGQIYNTIANGVRTMPAYGSQIPVEDRWAIVAYVRALQRSQAGGESTARSGDESTRESLAMEAGSP
jgi:mono/diheme cytochrome c family protein